MSDPIDFPSDAMFLEAAGWISVASARRLAKAVVAEVGVAIVDTNGAQGAVAYPGVEFFFRTRDGEWVNAGHFGPAGVEGRGSYGGLVHAYGRSSAPHVTVAFGRNDHVVRTERGGWWISGTRPDPYAEEMTPIRVD